jgi:hypothetical protein
MSPFCQADLYGELTIHPAIHISTTLVRKIVYDSSNRAHIDHIGNPSTFPPSATLVVGPGAQAHTRPGYPLNENAHFPESDFLGREVVEIEFKDDAPTIAGLKAHDYFGDGSFYLLDAPGVCSSIFLQRCEFKLTRNI